MQHVNIVVSKSSSTPSNFEWNMNNMVYLTLFMSANNLRYHCPLVHRPNNTPLTCNVLIHSDFEVPTSIDVVCGADDRYMGIIKTGSNLSWQTWLHTTQTILNIADISTYILYNVCTNAPYIFSTKTYSFLRWSKINMMAVECGVISTRT